MFLVHPTLTKEEIKKTCDVLTEVALANYDDQEQLANLDRSSFEEYKGVSVN